MKLVKTKRMSFSSSFSEDTGTKHLKVSLYTYIDDNLNETTSAIICTLHEDDNFYMVFDYPLRIDELDDLIEVLQNIRGTAND